MEAVAVDHDHIDVVRAMRNSLGHDRVRFGSHALQDTLHDFAFSKGPWRDGFRLSFGPYRIFDVV